MTDSPAGTSRHSIGELGLSFDIEGDWALDTFPLDGGAIVSLRLPGEAGAFFVRYGADQTLETFLAGLGGGLTTVAVVADEPVVIAGRPARRVRLAIRQRGGGTYRDDGPERERSPSVQSRIVVLGLSLQGRPVLIGYRLYEDEIAAYEPVLERTLAGITIEDGETSGPEAAVRIP